MTATIVESHNRYNVVTANGTRLNWNTFSTEQAARTWVALNCPAVEVAA